jgi:hypothetical protein
VYGFAQVQANSLFDAFKKKTKNQHRKTVFNYNFLLTNLPAQFNMALYQNLKEKGGEGEGKDNR